MNEKLNICVINFIEVKTIRPKIKFCLFPLSDRPTKIAATQKAFIASFDEKLFLDIFFFIRIIHELGEYI
jgi:hypothetical protein